MKKIILHLSVLMVLTTIFLTSCSKDEVDARDQYVASYIVNESYVVDGITNYSTPYSMIITKSAQDPNIILMSNFAGYGVSYIVKSEVAGTKFTIPQQSVGTRGFSGSGSINNGNLSFTYQESSTDVGLWNVTASGTKQ